MIFARKINKIPEFYMIYARKKQQNAHILHDFCPKNIFPEFFLRGASAPCPSVSYAYGSSRCCGAHCQTISVTCRTVVVVLDEFLGQYFLRDTSVLSAVEIIVREIVLHIFLLTLTH